MKLTIEGPCYNTSQVCEPILRSLPEWFGIETDLAGYIEKIDILPTFLAPTGRTGGRFPFTPPA